MSETTPHRLRIDDHDRQCCNCGALTSTGFAFYRDGMKPRYTCYSHECYIAGLKWENL